MVRWFFELTLKTKRITPCKRVWKTVPENEVFSCTPFCLRSLGCFERCDVPARWLQHLIDAKVVDLGSSSESGGCAQCLACRMRSPWTVATRWGVAPSLRRGRTFLSQREYWRRLSRRWCRCPRLRRPRKHRSQKWTALERRGKSTIKIWNHYLEDDLLEERFSSGSNFWTSENQVRFQETHDQSLRQLFLTVSKDLRP